MTPEPKLTFTLLSDGSSDKVLTKILTWIIKQHLSDVPVLAKFGDLRRIPNPPKKLEERIQAALEYYACDILFVHRDAEKHSLEVRKHEISEAWQRIESVNSKIYMVAVVPVRMTEAWLLFDEESIKIAAGNPNYHDDLSLPSLQHIEKLPNPKADLYELIKKASNLHGRKLGKLKTSQRVHVLVDNIADFSPLRNLPAFQKLEDEIKNVLNKHYPS